jgi:hypothetical protein
MGAPHPIFGLELTRFRGQITLWVGGVHDAAIESAVSAGVSPADGGAGTSRAHRGVPRIHAELLEEGTRVSRKPIARLMRQAGLEEVSQRKRVRTTQRREDARPVPDLIERDFVAEGPDRLWVADIERHEALLNLAVVEGHRLWPVAAGRKKLRAA